MSQTQRQKLPLDVLQSMINGILIEIGRALRASDKEGGRTLATANTRLKSFFPSAIDNFHQALDDLECDIVRAKAVFLRDLEELRAQRYALENPPTEDALGDTATSSSPAAAELQGNAMLVDDQTTTPQPTIKEENTAPQIPHPLPTADHSMDSIDESKEIILKVADSSKDLQGPSPPSSLNDTSNKSNPVGLGIDTTGTTDDTAPATAGPPDSSIDSLFDMPENSNNGDSEMHFETEFLQDSNTNAHDPSQPEFDLSTFGNESGEFSMHDMHSSTENDTVAAGNKQDDLFNTGDDSGDMMDIDLDLDPAGGDGSLFADMFLDGADDENLGREMEHGHYDNEFFGLD